MSDLNTFLAEESGSEPTQAELEGTTPESIEPEAEAPAEPVAQEPPAEAPEGEPEAPPTGLDKRGEAIWREERTRRKQLQEQVDKMNARWEQMVERMQAGQTQQPQAPQPAAEQAPEIEIPDFDEDPIGHLRAKNELLERQLMGVTQQTQQQQAATQQAQQFHQFQDGVDAMEKQYATANPDYHDAVGYLYGQVGKMATAMGYTPEQVKGVVAQTAMDITVRSLQQGKNPAEAAYAAAKQMGWAGVQPAAEDNGEQLQPTPQKKPPTSLSSVAGKRTAGGAPTLDALAEMDDESFEKMWKDMEKSARKSR